MWTVSTRTQTLNKLCESNIRDVDNFKLTHVDYSVFYALVNLSIPVLMTVLELPRIAECSIVSRLKTLFTNVRQ